jgi:hypothetical protein
MSAVFQRLANGLPERHVPRRNSFACDAKSLRAWLAQLPLANPGATARLLIGAVREMNQLRIDPVQRVEAHELLRAPIDNIVTTLGKQVYGDSFPLPPQKQQLGQLAQDFEHELALGYCAAIVDLCSPAGAVPFLRGKTVALALARAIQHRGMYLHEAYLRYHAPPAGAWQNLHDLFRFAVAIQADEKPVADELHGAATSVRLAYMHELLFALSNPYRFTQRENAEIHELTRLWAAHCELREGRAPVGAVAIHADTDRGPGYLPEERAAPDEECWALEISGLVRFLDGHLSMLPPGTSITGFGSRGGPHVQTSVDLVARLMRSWENDSSRMQTRLPAGHQLESVIGLHDLHYVLAGNMDFEAFLIKTRGIAITLHEGDRAATWAGSPSLRARRVMAAVLDQSLSGYRLAWEKIDGMRMKVGELLGLAPPADDDEARDWMVGVVRWMRIEVDGGMQVGVELLARRALAAAVRSFDAQGMPRAALRAVALYGLEGGEGIAAVMTPQLFDRDATEIELTRPGDPFSWPVEPVIDVLRDVHAGDNGGGYLRIDLQAPDTVSGNASVAIAANDDTDARANGSA